MNKMFGLDFTLNQIKGAINRYNLNTGFTGQFNKGHEPVNKGVKGVVYEGCKKTWFIKGGIPKNHRPVGSERINVDGYVEIKVAEPSKWRLKHQVVWEKHKGPIPNGYVVIFGDGNKLNLDINNLVLVSKNQLLILNRYKLIQNDADLTRTGVIIADLHQKISEVSIFESRRSGDIDKQEAREIFEVVENLDYENSEDLVIYQLIEGHGLKLDMV